MVIGRDHAQALHPQRAERFKHQGFATRRHLAVIRHATHDLQFVRRCNVQGLVTGQ